MFVTESVHDEAVFGDECVSIGWFPYCCFFRKLAPREIDLANTKKAIASKFVLLFTIFSTPYYLSAQQLLNCEIIYQQLQVDSCCLLAPAI